MRNLNDVKVGEVLRWDRDINDKKYSTYILVKKICKGGCLPGNSPQVTLCGDTFTCDYFTGDNFETKRDVVKSFWLDDADKTVVVDMYEPFRRYMQNAEIKAVEMFYKDHLNTLLNSKDKWLEFCTDYGDIVILVKGVLDRGNEIMFNCHIKAEKPEVNIPKQEVKIELDTTFHLSKFNFEYLNYKVLNPKEAKDRIADFMVKLIEKKL